MTEQQAFYFTEAPTDLCFIREHLGSVDPTISQMACLAMQKHQNVAYLQMALSVAKDRLNSTLMMIDKVLLEVGR